jgi:macrodomain Ter protein organizer (MatP/YcbG family)
MPAPLPIDKPPYNFRKPVRISITLSYQSWQHLVTRSDNEGRSISNLSAYLIERALSLL